MNNELISVIVCIFNREKYLKKCIESIINQTYKNIEIILIDDGSTDLSYNICKKYAKLDYRIKLLQHDNHGIAFTRNRGIKEAKGKYLCMVDSDDYIDKNYCLDMYKKMIEYDCDLVICDIMQISKAKKFLISSEEESRLFKDDLMDLLFLNYRIINPINKLYKSEIIKKCEYPNNKIHEDAYVIYDILSQCNIVYYYNKVLYYRNLHSESIMSSNTLDRLNEIESFEHWITKFKENCDIVGSNKSTVKAMKSILRNYCVLNNLLSKKQKEELYDKFVKYYGIIKNNISFSQKIKFKTFKYFPSLTVVLSKFKKMGKVNK